MVQKLSKEDVLKLARLSKLRLSDEEVEKYQNELAAILDYVVVLNSVDLDSYNATSQVTGLTNVTREDVVKPQIANDLLLKNVPQREGRYIKVKRMLT